MLRLLALLVVLITLVYPAPAWCRGYESDEEAVYDLKSRGYTLVAKDTISGQFLGNYDEVHKLYNGMVFRNIEGDYNYEYEYYPTVYVFKTVFQGRTLWQLVVDKHSYSVLRLR